MTNTQILKYITSYSKIYKLRVYSAFVALILIVFSMLMIGQSFRKFINQGFSKFYSKAIFEIITLIILFGFASFVRSFIINITAEKISNDIKKRAFKKLLSNSLHFLKYLDYSDISNRINKDSEYISKIITDLTSFFMRNFLLMLGSLIMMFYTTAKLSFTTIIMLSIILMIAKKISLKLRLSSIESEKLKSNISSTIDEAIYNNKIISIFNTQNSINSFFEKINDQALSKIISRYKTRAIFFSSSITLILLSITLIIWYGSISVSKGEMLPGDLAAFIFYSILMASSFGGLAEMFGDLQKNLANCERILEISEYKENIQETEKINLKYTKIITLNNINFSYEKNEINNINNFEIKNLNVKFLLGKFYGIVGKSGCGKTTLIHILLGLLKPTSGKILIDSKKYDFLNPTNWNGQIAYVPQDSNMFSGTILDNLYFFDVPKDKNEINIVINGLDLEEYINSLNHGYNSRIENLSSNISGGQKQRLSIARALLKKPEILVLDEATSQLDLATEKRCIKFIKDYMKGKTIISIAHRPNAIEDADAIIEL